MEKKTIDLAGGLFVETQALVDNLGNPISSVNPMNVQTPDFSATGTITVINSNGSTGPATANSAVTLSNLNDCSTISIQVTGTYTGALTPQVSINGWNWISMGTTSVVNVSNNAHTGQIGSAAQGIFQIDVAGFPYFRLVALSTVTGTATVVIRATQAAGMIGLDAPIPPGSNFMGGVSLGSNLNSTVGTNNHHLVSTATTNTAVVRGSGGGRFYGFHAINTSASDRYYKVFNKSTNAALGTDTPMRVFKIPANGTASWSSLIGLNMSAGIAIAITANPADTDATAIGAGEVIVDTEHG